MQQHILIGTAVCEQKRYYAMHSSSSLDIFSEAGYPSKFSRVCIKNRLSAVDQLTLETAILDKYQDGGHVQKEHSHLPTFMKRCKLPLEYRAPCKCS